MISHSSPQPAKGRPRDKPESRAGNLTDSPTSQGLSETSQGVSRASLQSPGTQSSARDSPFKQLQVRAQDKAECRPGNLSDSCTSQGLSETSKSVSRISLQSPGTQRSCKESPLKQLRVRQINALVAAFERKARDVLQQRLRRGQCRERYGRALSATALQSDAEARGRFYTQRVRARRCASVDDDSRSLKRTFLEGPSRRGDSGAFYHKSCSLEDILTLPTDVSFVAFREKLKRWLLAEGKGLELARGEKMSYKEWLRYYHGEEKADELFGSQQQSVASKPKSRTLKVALRLQQWSVSAQAADVHRAQNPEGQSPPH